jgi:hypothetical protein
MILDCSVGCNSPPADSAVLKNLIDEVTKGRFEFYTRIFSRVGWQIAGWNPFSRRKTPSNTRDTRLLPTPRNDRGIDALVTTITCF